MKYETIPQPVDAWQWTNTSHTAAFDFTDAIRKDLQGRKLVFGFGVLHHGGLEIVIREGARDLSPCGADVKTHIPDDWWLVHTPDCGFTICSPEYINDHYQERTVDHA